MLGAGDAAVLAWGIVKWPVMLVLVTVLLAVLFWASPNAKPGAVRWISPGGVIAVLIWVGASALFALYVTLFGSYDKTYGSMAGIVIFPVWLWLTNIALLLGAEINAELDRGRAIAEGLPRRRALRGAPGHAKAGRRGQGGRGARLGTTVHRLPMRVSSRPASSVAHAVAEIDIAVGNRRLATSLAGMPPLLGRSQQRRRQG